MPKVFVDLGHAPPSNSYLERDQLNEPELTFPLRLRLCEECWLVQTEDFTLADQLFDANYAYFSSTSKSWLDHSAQYASSIIERLSLNEDSYVVEVASNDGYLLKNFMTAGVPCLGIEPTASTAALAEKMSIPVLREFFGSKLGERLALGNRSADLVIGNNVYAHVPDINDFTAGLKALLKPEGVVTLEFPHLMRLVEFCQFDTIYHEHFSYLSLITVSRIFKQAGLRIFDVEELKTHGGSLRIYGCHHEASHHQTAKVSAVLAEEYARGMNQAFYYSGFQSKVNVIKNKFLQFLLDAKREGKKVGAFGAAAKGNTLLNYAGVQSDILSVIYDSAPSKQGKFMPGSHIPILSTDELRHNFFDYLIILPWNIASEVRAELGDLSALGTRFVTVVPDLLIK